MLKQENMKDFLTKNCRDQIRFTLQCWLIIYWILFFNSFSRWTKHYLYSHVFVWLYYRFSIYHFQLIFKISSGLQLMTKITQKVLLICRKTQNGYVKQSEMLPKCLLLTVIDIRARSVIDFEWLYDISDFPTIPRLKENKKEIQSQQWH